MSRAIARSVRDVSDPQVLKAEVELLAMPTDADERHVLQKAAQMALSLTGSDSGFVFYVDSGNATVRVAARAPEDAADPDEQTWQRALQGQKPQAWDPPADDGATMRYLSVPVVTDQEIPMILALQSGPGEYGSEHVATAQALADSAWTVVQRQREMQAMKDRLNLLSGSQSIMGVATWEWDPASEKVSWDPAAGGVVPGLSPTCSSWAPLIECLDDDSAVVLLRALSSRIAFSVDLSGVTVDGTELHLLLQGQPRDGHVGDQQLMRGTLMDVSMMAALEEAHRRATHDPLTGLPNRLWLLEALAGRMEKPLHRREDQFALFFIDLDDFKAVNDEFGHIIGDDVLASCARRIQGAIRGAESVARFGGDEFVLIQDGPLTWQSVEALAHRVRAAVSKPVRVGERLVQVGASIGIALCASDQWSTSDLLRQADDALMAAKSSPWGVVIRDERGSWDA